MSIISFQLYVVIVQVIGRLHSNAQSVISAPPDRQLSTGILLTQSTPDTRRTSPSSFTSSSTAIPMTVTTTANASTMPPATSTNRATTVFSTTGMNMTAPSAPTIRVVTIRFPDTTVSVSSFTSNVRNTTSPPNTARPTDLTKPTLLVSKPSPTGITTNLNRTMSASASTTTARSPSSSTMQNAGSKCEPYVVLFMLVHFLLFVIPLH